MFSRLVTLTILTLTCFCAEAQKGAEIGPWLGVSHYFGDLNNPAHLVHKLAKSREAFRLLESSKTGPQVYYLSRRKWVRDLRDRLAGALDGKKRS